MSDERSDRTDRAPASGEGRDREDIAPRGRPAPDDHAPTAPAPPRVPPETDEHPAPGIEHEPEPDAENIVPAKDRPGTL